MNKPKQTKNEDVVEVLYQKIGNRWYSFFVIDDDVFMGSVPNEAIEDLRPQTDRGESKSNTRNKSRST